MWLSEKYYFTQIPGLQSVRKIAALRGFQELLV